MTSKSDRLFPPGYYGWGDERDYKFSEFCYQCGTRLEVTETDGLRHSRCPRTTPWICGYSSFVQLARDKNYSD